MGLLWIPLSVITMICNAILPTFTPIVNSYAYGSGIIATYFIGTAIISLIGMIVMSIFSGGIGSILLPSLPVLVSGILYGAGSLALQKSIERSPNPALSMVLPRNRAGVNALLAFILFGISGSLEMTGIYIAQVAMLIMYLIQTDATGKANNETYSWHVYSFISMLLVSSSDVFVKNMVGIDRLLGNIVWFSLAGSIIPMISQYRKTGDLLLTPRDDKPVEHTQYISLALLLTSVFAMKVVSQYAAISMAPDSANVRLVGSFAVPLTVVLCNVFRDISIPMNELYTIIILSIISFSGGVRSVFHGNM